MAIHIEHLGVKEKAVLLARWTVFANAAPCAYEQSLLSKLDSRYGNLDSMQAESPWSVSMDAKAR